MFLGEGALCIKIMIVLIKDHLSRNKAEALIREQSEMIDTGRTP